MSGVFLHLLNISITAGWIVLIVVLLRFVLKKAPKWIRVALWGLVALRLLVPVSIESALSLVPSAETVQIEAVKSEPASVPGNVEEAAFSQSVSRVEGERIVIRTGLPAVNSLINQPAEKAAEHVDTVAVLKTVAGWVWLGGAIAMLLYALISYLRLRLRVRASIKVEKGIYVCDGIRDPFILGFIFPRIYLPSGMDETTKGFVLAHEKAHLKRFDHVWKPLGFLLLAVYWFNPLLWLAYILLCRDIELACDEKVVKEYDAEAKAAYSEALLKCSVSRRSIAACPLAFGETGVKSRIKSVLNYKKPAFWIILVALLAGIVVGVCFLTMPKKDKTEARPETTPAPTDDPETIPIPSGEVLEWLDYYSASSEMPQDQYREIAVDAFPGVTFRWSSGSVEAVKNDKTRTLFSGMPIWNVFFTDVTGDGKPELCATVSFGSGIIDEHIVVYDYANRQSYTLWDRFNFDYHLYMADGQLLVGKMPYNGDKQVDYGTLTMQDGVPCCQWHSDGSFTPLNRELHESELYGEWLIEEETDNDGNVLYTFDVGSTWKEYRFAEDGTVTYNETVPVSSEYEKAFGHPVSYPYEVHNDYVYIAGDDTSGAFRFGQYDRETRRLTLMYNTDDGTIYATLRRMGEDAQNEAALDEATLCTTWMLAELEAPDGSSGDARALGLERYLVFRSDGTVRVIDVKAPSDRVVPYTQSGNTVQFDNRVLRYEPEYNELIEFTSTHDVLSYTPAPNTVLPEETASTYIGTWELYSLNSFYQEYSAALLSAMELSYSITLQEDGTGMQTVRSGSESIEYPLRYTADGNDLIITLQNTEAEELSYSAVYDPEGDALTISDLFEIYTYMREGSVHPSFSREIAVETLLGVWETKGIQISGNTEPILTGTLEFREDGRIAAELFTASGSMLNEFTYDLDGNIIRFGESSGPGSFLVYDSLTDSLQLPIPSIGVLTFTRKTEGSSDAAISEVISIDVNLLGAWILVKWESDLPSSASSNKWLNELIASGEYVMTYRFAEDGSVEVVIDSYLGSGTYQYTYSAANDTITFQDIVDSVDWTYAFDGDQLLLSKGGETQRFERIPD